MPTNKLLQDTLLKAKAPKGVLINSASVPGTLTIDAPPPGALADLTEAVFSYAKAAALVGASGLAAPGTKSLEGLFAARLARMPAAVQAEVKKRAADLAALPIEQRRAELGHMADAGIGKVASLGKLALPADVVTKLKAGPMKLSPMKPADVTRLSRPLGSSMTTRAQALTAAATPTMELLVDWLRCDTPTSGPGDDEIVLGGSVILPSGQTLSFSRGRVADSMNTGKVQTFSPSLVIHEFPMLPDYFLAPPDGPGQMGFSVVLALGEEDNGGFDELLSGVTASLELLVFVAISEAIGAAVPVAGAIVAFVLGALARKLFDWVRGWWNDDLIAIHSFSVGLTRPLIAFGNGSQYSRQETVFAGDGGQYTLGWSWHTRVNGLVDSFRAGPFEIVKLVKESAVESHPHAQITLPDGFKILGGGAWTNYAGAGSLLTEAYPSSPSTWSVAAKDHLLADPCSITAIAFGARLADGRVIPEEQYRITRGDSDTSAHPSASVACPEGFALVGGGAKVTFTEPGNLLTASYPQGDVWNAASKDHGLASPAQISAYVVSVSKQLMKDQAPLVTEATAPAAAAHPTVSAAAPEGTRILGGGARVNYGPPGSLLTGMRDQGSMWVAAAKDHKLPCPATVTAFALSAPSAEALALSRKTAQVVVEKSVFADNVAGWGAGNYQTIQFTVAPAAPRSDPRYVLTWSEAFVEYQNVTTYDFRPMPANDPDHLEVTVTVKGENWWGAPGRFRGLYVIWWEMFLP